jgi:hypothetical protein
MYEALANVANAMDSGTDGPYVEITVASATESAATPVALTVRILDAVGGDPIEQEYLLQLAAFDEADLVNPATNGVIQNATTGSILAGDGTAATKIKTAADGTWVGEVVSGVADDVFVGSAPDFGSPKMSTVDTAQVTFS